MPYHEILQQSVCGGTLEIPPQEGVQEPAHDARQLNGRVRIRWESDEGLQPKLPRRKHLVCVGAWFIPRGYAARVEAPRREHEPRHLRGDVIE